VWAAAAEGLVGLGAGSLIVKKKKTCREAGQRKSRHLRKENSHRSNHEFRQDQTNLSKTLDQHDVKKEGVESESARGPYGNSWSKSVREELIQRDARLNRSMAALLRTLHEAAA